MWQDFSWAATLDLFSFSKCTATSGRGRAPSVSRNGHFQGTEKGWRSAEEPREDSVLQVLPLSWWKAPGCEQQRPWHWPCPVWHQETHITYVRLFFTHLSLLAYA